MADSLPVISMPTGARGSARTSPVTRTEVSRVNCWYLAHTSGVTWVFTMTACEAPLPSRSTANATFPDERRFVTHACTVTFLPTCCWSSPSRVFFNDMIVTLGPEGYLQQFVPGSPSTTASYLHTLTSAITSEWT